LQTNQWYHLAVVFNITSLSIYVDGVLISTGESLPPNDIIRNDCYFGRSSCFAKNGDQYASAYFDEIRIFNRALSPDEIQYNKNLQFN